MIDYLKGTFLKNPNNWRFWLLLAFIAKITLFLFKVLPYQPQYIEGFWGSAGGDTPEYLTPIENFIKYGTYNPDLRMPGYGVAYLPFILCFSKVTACNLLIILQLLLSSISVYILALIARQVFKSDILFYSTFYLYAISSFVSQYDTVLLTESLTTSLLIFSVYFLVRYYDGYKFHKLFISGLLLTWVIFLRPVFIPVLVLFCIIIAADSIKASKGFMAALTFLIPFMIIDGLWIARNYNMYNKIIPLTKHRTTIEGDNNTYWLPAFKFVESWGGSSTFWDPRAEIRWFLQDVNTGQSNSARVTLPGDIYTSAFNKDSLETLRKIIYHLNTDRAITASEKLAYNQYLSYKFNLYAGSVKSERPILYYVKGPVRILKAFVIHICTINFFGGTNKELNLIENLMRLFYCVFNKVVFGFGCVGIVLLLRNVFKSGVSLIIPFIPLYIFLIHPLVFGWSEARYFIPAYPFMLICGVCATIYLIKKFKSRSNDFA